MTLSLSAFWRKTAEVNARILSAKKTHLINNCPIRINVNQRFGEWKLHFYFIVSGNSNNNNNTTAKRSNRKAKQMRKQAKTISKTADS